VRHRVDKSKVNGSLTEAILYRSEDIDDSYGQKCLPGSAAVSTIEYFMRKTTLNSQKNGCT